MWGGQCTNNTDSVQTIPRIKYTGLTCDGVGRVGALRPYRVLGLRSALADRFTVFVTLSAFSAFVRWCCLLRDKNRVVHRVFAAALRAARRLLPAHRGGVEMSMFTNVGAISNTTHAIGDEVVSGIGRVSSLISEDPTWYLGVLVEFVSTFCGTLGKQCWRLAAIASPRTPEAAMGKC